MTTSYVSVAVDIVIRSIPESFTYATSESLEVGQAVEVPFGKKRVIGYVIDIQAEPPQDVAPEKIKTVLRVLSSPTFSKDALHLTRWIATTYAVPFLASLKLFMPPGFAQAVKVACKKNTRVSDYLDVGLVTFAECTAQASIQKLRAGAYRQREVLKALSSGAMAMQEIRALVSEAGAVVKTLEKKGYVRTFQKKVKIEPSESHLSSALAPRPKHLTQDQVTALELISKAATSKTGEVVLLDGVTGSGKTEVYIEAIEEVVRHGKRVIVLVPEISLTVQTFGRFNARFNGRVALLHSQMSEKERIEQWWRIKHGECDVVIGARSALFAPVENLGMVVIDEEHDTSYKQESSPRYHAREVAEELVRHAHATLVLGSATPSEEALYNSENCSHWKSVRLTKRPRGAPLPDVEIVDMRGKDRVFSEELANALQETHARGEKSILLLNRRGFATFLMCEDCGCVPSCPHCSTSLTYHAKLHSLICHTCGRNWSFIAYPDLRSRCPNCKSRYLKQVGVGTERIEIELKELLPHADIIRMDADTTRTKNAHAKLLEMFDAASASVLLGTQMIAMGHDFPEVTLVGVINADVSLKFPDFRAPEQTYHLLEQVAGRAGRGAQKGHVIIQTSWPEHPVFRAVQEHKRELFLELDIRERKEASYPPHTRLANIVVSSINKNRAQAVVEGLALNLKLQLKGASGYELLGPSACLKEKVKDRYRFHVELKAPRTAELGFIISKALKSLDTKGVSIAVDIDAYNTF